MYIYMLYIYDIYTEGIDSKSSMLKRTKNAVFIYFTFLFTK